MNNMQIFEDKFNTICEMIEDQYMIDKTKCISCKGRYKYYNKHTKTINVMQIVKIDN